MNNKEEVGDLVSRILERLGDRELTEMLDPCTRLVINIKVLRGQNSVDVEGTYQMTRARHIDLSTGEPPNEELWGKIFSLQVFSEDPRRTTDKTLRAILLKIKERGCISDQVGVHQKAINEILESAKIPARMVYMANHQERSLSGFRIHTII